MTVRCGRWPTAGRAVIVALTVLAMAGCGNRDEIFHGVQFSRDGTTLVAAALMPGCACMTLASTHAPGGGDVVVVSRIYGQDLGQLVLAPGQPARLRFDWAGPANEDVYEMSAFALENGRRGQALVPLQDHVVMYGAPTPTSCQDTSCTFGTLNLSRAWSGQVGQAEVERHERGVTFTRAGQSLELGASLGSCGCVLLRNPTDTSVMLEARLRGRDIGSVPLDAGGNLQLAYDWGGADPDDVYTLTAASVPPTASIGAASVPPAVVPPRPVSPAPPALTPGGGSMMTTAMKISDHVQVLGEFDHMTCTPDGGTLAIAGSQVACPFGALNLNQMVASGATGTVGGPNAQGRGAPGPPASVPPR